MIEALAKAAENGMAKESLDRTAGQDKFRGLPEEIKSPGPDFRPPWKESPELNEKTPVHNDIPPWKSNPLSALENRPAGETYPGKLPPEISRAPGPDFKLPWENESPFKPEPSYFSRQDTPPPTDEQKEKWKKETGWPDEIIDSIASQEEYELYKNTGLKAEQINGKWCLVRTDIDWGQKDEFGRTNKERAEQGLAPLNKNGKPIELHHIGQNPDSPLAELTHDEHRGKGNDSVLHDKSQDSRIDRAEFQEEKEKHWKGRAKEN